MTNAGPDPFAALRAPISEDEDDPMSLRVALDFADNPRPYHSLACPADTNGELYEALKVLAAAYREATGVNPTTPQEE